MQPDKAFRLIIIKLFPALKKYVPFRGLPSWNSGQGYAVASFRGRFNT